jgi:hypothetical protein
LPNTIYTVQISTGLPSFSDYSSVTSAPNGVVLYTDDVLLTTQDLGNGVYYRLKQYVAP